jgi:hypothetical protein
MLHRELDRQQERGRAMGMERVMGREKGRHQVGVC